MVEFQENIICGRFFIKFPTKFLKNNMGEVKIEFQENNNGLHVSRRPSFLMGIFLYECHFQMIYPLSFGNESHRFILD